MIEICIEFRWSLKLIFEWFMVIVGVKGALDNLANYQDLKLTIRSCVDWVELG